MAAKVVPRAVRIGEAGLVGWRGRLAGVAARRISRRTAMSEQQVRAIFGALFLLLAVRYVVAALRK